MSGIKKEDFPQKKKLTSPKKRIKKNIYKRKINLDDFL